MMMNGKNVLLLGEQGIGDTMMFSQLIPHLQQKGAQVVLAPQDRLLLYIREVGRMCIRLA